MNLHTLPKIVTPKNRRLGRGHGSGRVKTSGRGTKGQKAKETIKLDFEGGQLPLIKRLPLYRGKGRNKPYGKKSLVVNLKSLQILPEKTKVTLEVLIKYKIISKNVRNSKIKILGDGQISKALYIALPISKSALKKIEAAGGKIQRSV